MPRWSSIFDASYKDSMQVFPAMPNSASSLCGNHLCLVGFCVHVHFFHDKWNVHANDSITHRISLALTTTCPHHLVKLRNSHSTMNRYKRHKHKVEELRRHEGELWRQNNLLHSESRCLETFWNTVSRPAPLLVLHCTGNLPNTQLKRQDSEVCDQTGITPLLLQMALCRPTICSGSKRIVQPPRKPLRSPPTSNSTLVVRNCSLPQAAHQAAKAMINVSHPTPHAHLIKIQDCAI